MDPIKDFTRLPASCIGFLGLPWYTRYLPGLEPEPDDWVRMHELNDPRYRFGAIRRQIGDDECLVGVLVPMSGPHAAVVAMLSD